MQPYIERAADVVSLSQIAVQVLLSRDNDDLEFFAMRPRIAPPPPEVFEGRNLRTVGVIGLHGVKSYVAWREPLEPRVIEVIAHAFLDYVRVLLGDNIAEHVAHAEVSELERIYALGDSRPV